MPRNNRLALPAIILAIAIGLFFSIGRPAEAGKLRIIIAVDKTEPEIGADMAQNAQALGIMFFAEVPDQAREIAKLSDEPLTGQTMLNAIDQLKVDPDDAIFFYYTGHGAFDPDRRETYLLASGDEGQPLFVSQVRTAIEKKRARLGVLIFDCCNTIRPTTGSVTFAIPTVSAPVAISPLIDSLFFQPNGMVVIESSAPGEYALIEPTIVAPEGTPGRKELHKGSLFTNCFLKSFPKRTEPTTSAALCRQSQAELDRRFDGLRRLGLLTLGNGDPITQNTQNISALVDGQKVDTR